jgi:hypothetical protein
MKMDDDKNNKLESLRHLFRQFEKKGVFKEWVDKAA